MKALVICGPTASGKTSLAVDCALALGTEIISADSMLVYKGLDIGTAKPTAEERKGVRHHLIDVAEPTEKFSVSDYEALALPVVQGLFARGKIPVICGGTGFYICALLYKSQFGNAGANENVRQKYEAYLARNGREALHALLGGKTRKARRSFIPTIPNGSFARWKYSTSRENGSRNSGIRAFPVSISSSSLSGIRGRNCTRALTAV